MRIRYNLKRRSNKTPYSLKWQLASPLLPRFLFFIPSLLFIVLKGYRLKSSKEKGSSGGVQGKSGISMFSSPNRALWTESHSLSKPMRPQTGAAATQATPLGPGDWESLRKDSDSWDNQVGGYSGHSIGVLSYFILIRRWWLGLLLSLALGLPRAPGLSFISSFPWIPEAQNPAPTCSGLAPHFNGKCSPLSMVTCQHWCSVPLVCWPELLRLVRGTMVLDLVGHS